ncbi:MAG: DNA photolyase, partial [Desulfobacterales bacterium]|nr:DNA photolyase [Desulfobacterales bacterium]
MMIQKLYIDQAVRHFSQAVSIQSRMPGVPVSIVRGSREVYQSVLASDDPVKKGKTTLFLTRNKGAFIKECPGTRSYTCCGYQILHMGTFCTMDCSYCILQTYFHPPVLQYFVNHGDLLQEL